jgi:hypothetical protein
MLDEFAKSLQLFAEIVAERVGRPPDDPAVRSQAGAVIGVGISAWYTASDHANPKDYLSVMDASLAHPGGGPTAVTGRVVLVVAVAQLPCVPYEVAANAAAHAAAIRSAAARVVLLPELSLTGHELNAPAVTADSTCLPINSCPATASSGSPARPADNNGQPGRLRVRRACGGW